MQALGLLPPLFGAILTAAAAVAIFVYALRGEKRNRMGMLAFTVFFGGLAVHLLLVHAGAWLWLREVIYYLSYIVAVPMLLLGIRVSYQNSTPSQRAEWLYLGRTLGLLLVAVIGVLWLLRALQG